MPFTKPKRRLYDIVLVGKNISELTNPLSKLDSKDSQRDALKIVFRKNGLEAEVNLWNTILQQSTELLIPSLVRKARAVLVALDFKTFNNLNKLILSLKNWFAILNNGGYEANEKIVAISVVSDSSEKDIDMIKSAVLRHCQFCYVLGPHLNASEFQNAGKRFLRDLCQDLLQHESSFYNDLESEMQSVDLRSDKSNLVNTTQCYEHCLPVRKAIPHRFMHSSMTG
ncbi:uncharacterized protein LOC143446946 [Clavelina lepadiformis]|uniref:uncharacterized protein LOC143446946 n=1 Tax=Clavelina lepadiformis TaxID=159417 RepID=UPI00404243F8